MPNNQLIVCTLKKRGLVQGPFFYGYYLFSLLFLCPLADSADVNYAFGFLNDNYTNTIENGRTGRYIGADDFLTFSLFSSLQFNDYQGYLFYNIVTSRKNNFRYDLLTLDVNRRVRYRGVDFFPGIEIVVKENLAGEVIQNQFHDLISLPKVWCDYDGPAFGAGVLFDARYLLNTPFFSFDTLSFFLESRFPSGVLPIKSGMNTGYSLSWNRVSIEWIGGFRWYPGEVEHYSELIRTGVFGAMGIRIRFYRKLFLQAGIALFPVRNLETDPLYKPKNFNYSPQISWSLSNSVHSLRKIIRFF
ncbi:MAG: hypothetical protein HQK83_01455 [Fibrobacteria bacterium]|nr:hypothetical protein [Fibrobacteria bacterium]